MKVSIQGYRGSFHHIVAKKLWGDDVELAERATFTEVFADIILGNVPVAIVAVENTITGSIAETLDLLSQHPVKIIGEVNLRISQNLIVIPGTKLTDLKSVSSHPVALKQCLDFFKNHPAIKLIPTDDTSGSVMEMMAKGDHSHASIASSLAAELADAEILVPDIQSEKENITRFLIITKSTTDTASIISQTPSLNSDSSNQIKATVILNLKHQPGALAKCVNVIAQHHANLMRIESRPIRGIPWEYTMHIDMVVSNPEILDRIISELNAVTEKNDIKGVYQLAHLY